MIVDIAAKTTIKADIDKREAFIILCKTLAMDFVIDEDAGYFVRKDYEGKKMCIHHERWA